MDWYFAATSSIRKGFRTGDRTQKTNTYKE